MGTAAGPVLPTDRVSHLTFEPHLGLTDWAEVGGYLQTAVRPDGRYDYGGGAGRPQLDPAAKAEAMLVDDHLGVGAEYYGAIGPLDAPLPTSRQVHRLFGVVDVVQIPVGPARLAVNVGVGHDLGMGDQWIVKSIIGVEPR